MNIIKKNKKLLIGLILGIIITSGVVYAKSAMEITYTTDKNSNITNVSEALDYLYDNMSKDNYDNKTYIRTGITTFDSRITILSGGYYTDTDGTTYVNITFKATKNLSADDNWLLLQGLPAPGKYFITTDTDKKHAYKVDAGGAVHFFDRRMDTSIPINTTWTLQFKYKR